VRPLARSGGSSKGWTYRRTDLQQVWLTVEKDIPDLLKVVAPLAEETK